MVVIKEFRRMARAVAVTAALLSCACPAYAQQQPTPAALATAKDIVGTTGMGNLFAPLIPGVIEQSKVLFLQQNPSLAKDLNEISVDLRAKLQPRFDEITNEIAKQYATYFTEQELKDLLAFYKSPLGKKMLTDQPKVADGSVKFAQAWAAKLSDEVVQQMRAELKKRGHDL